MGIKQSYPTDIIEYQITDQYNITIWKGKSRAQLLKQLSKYLDQYAEYCSESRPLSITSVKVTRYFGTKLENNTQPSEDFDSYIIRFWKFENKGYNCVASVRSIRGRKGNYAISKDCYEKKHKVFEGASKETFKFLKSKTF